MPRPEEDRTERLLERLRDQRTESWHDLLGRFDGKLRVLLRLRSRSTEAREREDDVLQEVWTEALQGVGSFEYRGPGSLYAWLAAILRNKLRHQHRALEKCVTVSLSTDRSTGMPDGLVEALRDTQTSIGAQAARMELADRAVELLDSLDGPLRDTVLLRIYEGLSGREAAARLGVHESTVSIRFRDAMTQIGRRLEANA